MPHYFREETLLNSFFHGFSDSKLTKGEQITLGHTPITPKIYNICKKIIFKDTTVLLLCFPSDLAHGIQPLTKQGTASGFGLVAEPVVDDPNGPILVLST